MAYVLYIAVLETRGYIVGESNGASGLHRYDGELRWTHLGWRNLRHSGIAVEHGRPETLYLAAGNGVLRSTDGGRTWRITTGWRITEVQDVAADPHLPERVYAATAYGVIRTENGGDSWIVCSRGIPVPTATFIQSIAADYSRPNRVIAGSEEGLFVSDDGADSWLASGPRGVAIRAVRQSPVAPEVWLAGTEDHGLMISTDGGADWHSVDGPTTGHTYYAVALDPSNADRMAAAGYETGVFLSEDGGTSWELWISDLPEPTIHALAFDPQQEGLLWIGTVGRGVFLVAPDARWTHMGLENATVRDMLFVRTSP